MNYLITGLSGTGKTTIGEVLKARGYKVIEADTKLVKSGLKPWDGKPWVWDPDKAKRLIEQKSTTPLFVVGGAENQTEFLHYFKRVFELVADPITASLRVKSRGFSGPFRVKPHNIPGAVRINTDRCINASIYEILRNL